MNNLKPHNQLSAINLLVQQHGIATRLSLEDGKSKLYVESIAGNSFHNTTAWLDVTGYSYANIMHWLGY